MIFRFSNFGDTTLAASIVAGALSLQVPPSALANLPNLAPGERTALVLTDGMKPPEIVYATAIDEHGTLTIERGREGTVPQSWTTGTAIIQTLTRDTISWFTTGGADAEIADLQAQIDAAVALIGAETAARNAAIAALDAELDSINAGVNTLNSHVTAIGTAFSDLNAAWAQYQIDVNAEVGAAYANATTAMNVSVSNAAAIVTLETTLEAAIGDDAAEFAERIQALVDFDQAQVSVNQTLYTAVDYNSTQIANEVIARTTADSAEAILRQAVRTDFEAADVAANTRIDNEIIARSSADAAEIIAREALATTVTSNNTTTNTRIDNEITARSTADSALATRASTLEGQVQTPGTGLLARMTTEEGVRATADSVLAGRATALEVTINTPTTGLSARMSAEETVRASADSLLAGRATTLEGQVQTPTTGLLARMSAEESARLSGDTVLAGRATTLEARASYAERGEALNANPTFSDWTGSLPVGWQNWVGAPANLSKTAGRRSANSATIAGGAGVDAGLIQPLPVGSVPPGFYVLDVTAELISGTYAGAQAFVYNIPSFSEVRGLQLAVDPDTNGDVSVSKAGVRRWRKVVQFVGNMDTPNIYAAAHWDGFSQSKAAANSIRFHEVSIYPASSADMTARSLTASVGTLQSTVANLATQSAEARLEFVASTGGGTALFRLLSATHGGVGGTAAQLLADEIYFGDNTYFDDATDTLRTITGSVQMVLALGASFGTDGHLRTWFGPAGIAFGAMARGNAYRYDADTAPFVGGSGLAAPDTTPRVRMVGTTFKFISSNTTANASTDTVTFATDNMTAPINWSLTRITNATASYTSSQPGGANSFRATKASMAPYTEARDTWYMQAVDANGLQAGLQFVAQIIKEGTS